MATATVKYYAGTQELKSVYPVPNQQFFALGGAVSKGNYYDSFKRLVGVDEAGVLRPVSRKIFYKTFPSLHKCDARCRHAKGGNCECSCGGQFHGAGD